MEFGAGLLALSLAGDLLFVPDRQAGGQNEVSRIPLGISGIFFSGKLVARPGGGVLACLGGAGGRADFLWLDEGLHVLQRRPVPLRAFPVFSISTCQRNDEELDILLTCGKRAYTLSLPLSTTDFVTEVELDPVEILSSRCRLFSGFLTSGHAFVGSEHGEVYSISRINTSGFISSVITLERAQVWGIAVCQERRQLIAVTESGGCHSIGLRTALWDEGTTLRELQTREIRIQPKRDYCAFAGGSLTLMHEVGCFHGETGELDFAFSFSGNPYSVSHSGAVFSNARSGSGGDTLVHAFGLEEGHAGLAWNRVSSTSGFDTVAAPKAKRPEVSPSEFKNPGTRPLDGGPFQRQTNLLVDEDEAHAFVVIPLLCTEGHAVTSILLTAAGRHEDTLAFTLLVSAPFPVRVQVWLLPRESTDRLGGQRQKTKYSAIITEEVLFPIDRTEAGLVRIATRFFTSTLPGQAITGAISLSQLCPVVGTVVGDTAVVLTRSAIATVISGVSTERPHCVYIHTSPQRPRLALRVLAVLLQGILHFVVLFRDGLSVVRYDPRTQDLLFQDTVSRKVPEDAALFRLGGGFALVYCAEAADGVTLEHYDWDSRLLGKYILPLRAEPPESFVSWHGSETDFKPEVESRAITAHGLRYSGTDEDSDDDTGPPRVAVSILVSFAIPEPGKPRKAWRRELVSQSFCFPIDLVRVQSSLLDGSEVNALCPVALQVGGDSQSVDSGEYLVYGHESGVIGCLSPLGAHYFLWRVKTSIKCLAFASNTLFVGASNGSFLILLLGGSSEYPTGRPGGIHVVSSIPVELPLPNSLSTRYTAVAATSTAFGTVVLVGDGAGGLTAFVISMGLNDGNTGIQIHDITRIEISSVPLGITVLSQDCKDDCACVHCFVSGTLCVHIVEVVVTPPGKECSSDVGPDCSWSDSGCGRHVYRRVGCVTYERSHILHLRHLSERPSTRGATFGVVRTQNGAIAVTDGGYVVDYAVDTLGRLSLRKECWVTHCGLVAASPVSLGQGAEAALAVFGWDRIVRILSATDLRTLVELPVPIFNPHSLCMIQGAGDCDSNERRDCGAHDVHPPSFSVAQRWLVAAGSGIALAKLRAPQAWAPPGSGTPTTSADADDRCLPCPAR